MSQVSYFLNTIAFIIFKTIFYIMHNLMSSCSNHIVQCTSIVVLNDGGDGSTFKATVLKITLLFVKIPYSGFCMQGPNLCGLCETSWACTF